MATKTGELRETLIGAIDKVLSKTLTFDEAKAIAMLASQVNASLKVEIDAVRLLVDQGVKCHAVGLLALGEESSK